MAPVSKKPETRGRILNVAGGKITKNDSIIKHRCDCRGNCSTKLANSDVEFIRNDYQLIESFKEKQLYVRGLVFRSEVISKRRGTNVKNRTTNYKFLLRTETKTEFVCLNFFLNVLQISKSALYRWLGKRSNLELEHKLKGRSSNNKKDLTHVIEFLNKLPTTESHYSREKSNKRYLEPGTTLTSLYNMYRENSIRLNRSAVSKSLFNKTFHNETNLSIRIPRQDICNRCEELKIQMSNSKIKSRRKKLEEVKNDHLQDAALVRNEMKMDEQNPNKTTTTITIDFQKILPVPKLAVNAAYYSKTSHLNIFGIHELPAKLNPPHFYAWSEVDGGRGGQEVGSCVVDFIAKYLPETEHLIIFLDRCPSQNRNLKFVLLLLQYLSNRSNKLQTIDLKFMISGHSYLACDADFGLIEKACKARENIYDPDEYYEIIKRCRKENPAILNVVGYDFFKSSELMEDAVKRKLIDTDNEKFSWSSVGHISLQKSQPLKIYFRQKISDLEYKTLDLSKEGSSLSSLKEIPSINLFKQQRSVNEDKLKDIKQIMKFIPNTHQKYFKQICSSSPYEDESESH